MNRRVAALSALLAIAVCGLAVWQDWTEPLAGPALARLARAHPTRPTVILVVLDTVRADRTSLCGWPVPTTPTLERLAAGGARFTCGGVAPGAWTIPSHASFFTGVDTAAHRADFAGEGFRPLGPDLPTLAGQLAADGFQTAAISGNPVLAGGGLLRGFGYTSVPGGGLDRAPGVVRRLRAFLRFEADDRPLFLFVNLADAHDPWTGVPPRGSRVPPAGPWYTHARGEDGEFRRFLEQDMSAAEKSTFLHRLGALYDVGVAQADHGLGQVLATLEAHGWLSAGYRLVVTSDHGEHLGEGDLLDHGRYVTEEVVRVPILLDERPGPPPALPEVLWAGHVADLVRTGRIPDPPRVPVAVAVPEVSWQAWFDRPLGEELSVAVYDDTHRVLAQGEKRSAYAHGSDEPLPVADDDPLLPTLEAATRSARGLVGAPDDDASTREALRAIGYVE